MTPLRAPLLLAAAAAAVLAHGARAQVAKGVYGTDDRTDESSAASCVGEDCVGSLSASIRAVGTASTVALIPRTALRYDADTNSWVPTSASTLGTGRDMCPTDSGTGQPTRFVDQPTPGSCSGTVVQWDAAAGTGLVASAGHCFDANEDINGCQTTAGRLHPFPERTSPCYWDDDGECDDGLDDGGDGSFCAVGTEGADCPAAVYREIGTDQCAFYFVFDFTDQTLDTSPAPTSGPPVTPDGCDWPGDGECDVPTYCPSGTDDCDCLGTNCPPPPPPPAFSIPAANVYDCAEVVMCDLENLQNSQADPADWLVNGGDGHFTDFALARIVAAGIASVPRGCRWEDDGECDVPNYCPAGTDRVDCPNEVADSAALRAARTTDYSHLTRAVLDGGNPRTITPAPLFSGVLEQGDAITVIGHPSGLPRKYTGGAIVQHIAACQLDSICPDIAGVTWAAYQSDLDTFGGNSGSGTFTDDGRMIGILISGATDFVYAVGDWQGSDSVCREFARCGAGLDDPDGTGAVLSGSVCRNYDTSVALPASCVTDPQSPTCLYTDCDGAGLERQSCSGENVASIAAIINYLQVNSDPSTFSVVDGPIPVIEPAPEPTPAPDLTPDPTPDPTPAPTPAPSPAPVTATLTLAGDVAAVAGVEGSSERATFEQDFKTDVASALGVQVPQITITGIVAGSVAVTFAVDPCALCGGGAVTPAAVSAAFGAVVSLPTVGVSTTGPVSDVASASPELEMPASEPASEAPRKDVALAAIFGAGLFAGLVIWFAAWCLCCRKPSEENPPTPSRPPSRPLPPEMAYSVETPQPPTAVAVHVASYGARGPQAAVASAPPAHAVAQRPDPAAAVTVGQLRRQAADLGVDPAQIEDARDGNDPAGELRALIQRAQLGPAPLLRRPVVAQASPPGPSQTQPTARP